MSSFNLKHLIFGEYVFEAEVKSFPRLANMLAERKVYFWGNKQENEKIIFRSSLFSAEQIADLAKEASVPLRVVKKRGFPFLFSKYRKRYGLIFGLALGIFLFFFSQMFVWKINIDGNSTVYNAEIERALGECGISVGCFIPKIDVAAESNKLLMNCKSLSSAAISINGTHLSVSVLERTNAPEIIDTSGFYNVVADYDGVIIDIDAAEGSPEVQEGDVVYKGELLINCFIEGKNGSFRPTHARGRVYAAVNEKLVSKIPLTRSAKHYTGKVETKRVYYFLGWEIPSFSSTLASYEYFDAVANENILKLFGFIELPIREFRVTYSEYIPSEEHIDVSLAEIFAREEIADDLAEIGCEVLSCETKFTVDEKNGICVLEADAVIKRDIAKEVPLEIIGYRISERLPKARE